MHEEIQNLERALERVFTLFEPLMRARHDESTGRLIEPLLDVEAQAEVVKHLLVRICVYLEQALKVILRKYAQTKNVVAPTLVRYFIEAESLGETAERSANPSKGRIVETLKKLNTSWAEQFKERLRVSDLETALNSIVNYRNAIAHTGSVPVQSTFSDAVRYFESAKSIVRLLFEVCRDQPVEASN